MDVSLILKIGILGISVAVLHQVLSRSGRDEYAMLTALAGVVVILLMLLPQAAELLSILKRIMDF